MKKTITVNKKVKYNYEILETYEVGIKLTGPEVKSVKAGQVSLKESFVQIEQDPFAKKPQVMALIIKNMHISPYKFARQESYNPTRDRKLLAHKKEILKLFGETNKKNLTIVPLCIYIKNGKIKLEIALARGKKKWDKREEIKKREIKRELRKMI